MPTEKSTPASARTAAKPIAPSLYNSIPPPHVPDHELLRCMFFNIFWRLIYRAAVRCGLSDAESQDVGSIWLNTALARS